MRRFVGIQNLNHIVIDDLDCLANIGLSRVRDEGQAICMSAFIACTTIAYPILPDVWNLPSNIPWDER